VFSTTLHTAMMYTCTYVCMYSMYGHCDNSEAFTNTLAIQSVEVTIGASSFLACTNTVGIQLARVASGRTAYIVTQKSR